MSGFLLSSFAAHDWPPVAPDRSSNTPSSRQGVTIAKHIQSVLLVPTRTASTTKGLAQGQCLYRHHPLAEPNFAVYTVHDPPPFVCSSLSVIGFLRLPSPIDYWADGELKWDCVHPASLFRTSRKWVYKLLPGGPKSVPQGFLPIFRTVPRNIGAAQEEGIVEEPPFKKEEKRIKLGLQRS